MSGRNLQMSDDDLMMSFDVAKKSRKWSHKDILRSKIGSSRLDATVAATTRRVEASKVTKIAPSGLLNCSTFHIVSPTHSQQHLTDRTLLVIVFVVSEAERSSGYSSSWSQLLPNQNLKLHSLRHLRLRLLPCLEVEAFETCCCVT